MFPSPISLHEFVGGDTYRKDGDCYDRLVDESTASALVVADAT